MLLLNSVLYGEVSILSRTMESLMHGSEQAEQINSLTTYLFLKQLSNYLRYASEL